MDLNDGRHERGMSGYWGPPTALHTFCEPNYHTSTYFAEFWNSTSSLLYSAAAAYMLSKCEMRADPLVAAMSLALFVIGLGSFAFHGSMLFALELWDELPMLVFIACGLLSKAACLPPRLRPYRAAYTACALLAVVGSGAAYLVFQEYEIFVVSFTLIVLADLLLGLFQPAKARVIKWLKAMCLFTAVAGKVVWELENRMCATRPAVWPLHVVWHALSAGSAYFGVLANFTYRVECGLNPAVPPGRSCGLSCLGVPSAAWPVLALHAPPSAARPDKGSFAKSA